MTFFIHESPVPASYFGGTVRGSYSSAGDIFGARNDRICRGSFRMD